MELLNDRYKLAESIGSGGMSDVYAAEDTLLGREVAVKMLKRDMARDDNFRERFRREAQNSARLNHPNIVSVFDTGETTIDGVSIPFFVMERVHGQTLRDMVRESGPMSVSEAASLLVPVCHALQSSHDAGIIHRDIKPANIMITNTADVKIMDFGIARALDDATSAMTQTAAVIGTAQYLSPEQARGKSADARSDVYALGCVLYEAVTGSAPFDGDSPFAVAYQHVQEDPVPPSEKIHGSELSPTEAINIDAVVLTAMAKHPSDRYDSAAEMGEELDRLSRGTITQAARLHVEPAAEPAPAPVPAPAPAPQPASVSEKPRRRLWPLIAALLIIVAVGGLGIARVVGSNGGSFLNMDSMVTVPDLRDQPVEEAVAKLESLGFVTEVTEAPNPNIAEGNVISLNPAAGSELREGTTISVVVSSGQEMTEIPDLEDLSPQEAMKLLKDHDLRLNPDVEEENSDDVEEGRIISQSPAAGEQAPKGSEITVTVSLGAETVHVPSLSGLQVNEAESTLRSMDLKARIVQEDSTLPAGTVIRIDPEQTEVARGSTVTVVTSNEMLVEIPNITRMHPDQARSTLHDIGWSGRLVEGESVATAVLTDAGRIAYAEPEPGAPIRKDQNINIRLWEFDVARALQ